LEPSVSFLLLIYDCIQTQLVSGSFAREVKKYDKEKTIWDSVVSQQSSRTEKNCEDRTVSVLKLLLLLCRRQSNERNGVRVLEELYFKKFKEKKLKC